MTIRRKLWAIAIACALAIGLGAATAATMEQEEVTLQDARVVPADGEEGVAHVYGVVRNPSMYDVYLISAASNVSTSAEFRRMTNGESKKAADLTVPAYGSLAMTSDKAYVRLDGLQEDLKPGDRVELTIKTDGGVSLRATAEVK